MIFILIAILQFVFFHRSETLRFLKERYRHLYMYMYIYIYIEGAGFIRTVMRTIPIYIGFWV